MLDVSSYDGKGFGLSHDYCDIESMKPVANGAYALDETYTAIQMDTAQSLHVTVKPLSRRSFCDGAMHPSL